MRRNGRACAHGPQARRASDYRALATDGDGTLISRKRMARGTVTALERLRASGRKVVLVTGETQRDLAEFPHLHLFDLVVAENGAALYHPASGELTRLAEPPPADFVRQLRRRGVTPTSVGQVIVSVRQPAGRALARVIRDLGPGWRVIRNRRQVMALPAGVDKATGLAAALRVLGLSPPEVVGVGDAENDLALLRACGCGVAVASAVPLLRQQADLVTGGGAGTGVVELIQRLLAGDLPAPAGRRKAGGRHDRRMNGDRGPHTREGATLPTL